MKKSLKSKKTRNSTNNNALLERLPNNHGEYLDLLIYMTEKHINPGSKDSTMQLQATRLRDELKTWRKANKR